MKKIFIFIMAVCLMAGNLNAQKTYIRLGVGGGIGLQQYEGGNWANQTVLETSNNCEFKSMGLGGGLNANLAFGYMLSNNVGIELGVNEFIGLNKKIKYTETRNTYNESSEVKLSGMMLQIVPAIVVTPHLDNLNPYARLGMIIGILPSVVEKVNTTTTYTSTEKAASTTNVIVYKEKNSGGVALGFTAAGGVDVKLGEKLFFFAELVFNGITYAPTKGKIKEWTVDGVDNLATATTKEKEWTFEKKYDLDENIPDGNKDKRPKQSVNFSNAELNIGIKLNL